MTIEYLSSKRIQGLSGDTKPTNVPDNTEFVETNTGNVYKISSGTWSLLNSATGGGSFTTEDFSYLIYYTGSQYAALNGTTGVVDYTNTTDAASVINSAVTAVSTAGGGLIQLSSGTFLIRSIIVPKNNVWIQGQGEATIIKQDTTQNLAAMFRSLNYTTLIGTSDPGGVESFYMSYLVIDGNKANNVSTATDGLLFYGYNWKIDHVHIRHMRGNGMKSEWEVGSGLVPNSLTSMEAHYSHLKIHDCELVGWTNRGPHDWEGEHITIYDCGSHGYVQEHLTNFYSGSGYVDTMHIFACDGIYGAWIKGGTLHYTNLTCETAGNGTPGAGGIGLFVDGGAVYGTGLWCYLEDRGVVYSTGGSCMSKSSHIENCYDSGVEVLKGDVIFDGYVANNGEKGIIVGSVGTAVTNVQLTGMVLGHTQAQIDWKNAGNALVSGYLNTYTNSTNPVTMLNPQLYDADTNTLLVQSRADGGTAVRFTDNIPAVKSAVQGSNFVERYGGLTLGANSPELKGILSGCHLAGGQAFTFDDWEGWTLNLSTVSGTADKRAGFNGGDASMAILCTRRMNPVLKQRIKIPDQTSSRYYTGFSTATTIPVTNAPLASGDKGVIVGYGSSDTTWFVYRNDGTGAAPTAINTSLAKNGNWTTIEIKADELYTNFSIFINNGVGTYTTTLTTRIPGSGDQLVPYSVIENTTTSSRSVTYGSTLELRTRFIP